MSREPLDAQPGLYPDGIGKANEYTLLPGVCVLPLAEDPPTDPEELKSYSPVVIARLHAPFRIRKVAYDSRKVNNPPAGIPAPADAGAFVFLGGSVSVVTALNSSLSNFDWSVGTDYTFVENCVSRVEDGFVLGSYQVPTVMAQQNAREEAGLNLFQSGGTLVATVDSPGAIRWAGVDAQTGFVMGNDIDFFDAWGYNQDAFLPGTLFNERVVNGDVSTVGIAELRTSDQ